MSDPHLQSSLDDLSQLMAEIRTYREAAYVVLVGAQNMLAYNPDAPSNEALRQMLTVYQHVVATADMALTVLTALTTLIDLGYPTLPAVPVSPAAWEDLAQDMTTNQAALNVMSVTGAVQVTSLVGTEEPATQH